MYPYQVPSEIKRFLDKIAIHNDFLIKTDDGKVLIDNQLDLSNNISKIIETACTDEDLPLEKKVVILFLSDLLEKTIFCKTEAKLRKLSKSSDTHYGGYFESTTFPRGSLRTDSSTNFLYPKVLPNNWFEGQINASKSYTKKRIASNLILMAMVSDSIDRNGKGIVFDFKKYHKYIRKMEFEGYTTVLIQLVSFIPIISNLLVPISTQIENSIFAHARFHMPRYISAVKYYEYIFLRDFPKDIFEVFRKLPDYIEQRHFDIFGSDTLFDLLSLHFKSTLNLNQLELNTFVNWIYPPFLVVEKTNKKSPAFFSNNWEHLNNWQLKYYLNE